MLEWNLVVDFEVKMIMKIMDGKEFLIVICWLFDDKVVYVVVVLDLLDIFYDLV